MSAEAKFIREFLEQTTRYSDADRDWGVSQEGFQAIEYLDRLVAQHRPPTVRELQDVIANHVRNLEPVAISRGVALAVHAFLTQREEAMQSATRPPEPGEYVDPQPAAVDVAGDEREHVLSKDCWCNPKVESTEDDSIEHAQMLAQTDE